MIPYIHSGTVFMSYISFNVCLDTDNRQNEDINQMCAIHWKFARVKCFINCDKRMKEELYMEFNYKMNCLV